MALTDRARCILGLPRWVKIDPTGGDPWLGGPVLLDVCAHCKVERAAHP